MHEMVIPLSDDREIEGAERLFCAISVQKQHFLLWNLSEKYPKLQFRP